MDESNRHLIARQVLELEVPTLACAPEVQETAAQRFRTQVLPEIEALFDRFGKPDRVVRLERVELDLGDLDGTDWQTQFQSRLLVRLEESLERATVTQDLRSTTEATGKDVAFEQYLFFLQHGRLPWWSEIPPAHWQQQVLRALNAVRWQALIAVLACDARARRRLLVGVDDSTLSLLMERQAGLREASRVMALWRPADLPVAKHAAWRNRFWLSVLECTDAGGEINRGEELAERLLQLRAAFCAPEPTKKEDAGANDALPDLPPPWQDWLAVVLSDTDPSRSVSSPDGDVTLTADDGVRPKRSGEKSASLPSDSKELPEVAIASTRGLPRIEGAMERSGDRRVSEFPPAFVRDEAARAGNRGTLVSTDDAIHLDGAGCIILHPFLEELFRSIGLLEGCDFCDAAARGRAVRLLSLLTFGDEAAPEYELLLPKLLCGMAWEEVLEPVELTDDERAACDELLQAVLKHWRALKSNSTEWLREQFFLRTAKLEPIDSDWRLSVERRAQDVLLDTLPWGLGVIDLPWGPGRIFVYWMK